MPAPSENGPPEEHRFVVNPFRALVPLVPLLLLYLLAPPLELFKVPHHWLEDLPPEQAPPGRFESRLIGTAMLIGVAVAALAVPRKASRAAFGKVAPGAALGAATVRERGVLAPLPDGRGSEIRQSARRSTAIHL